MTMASLNASLLARKRDARPTGRIGEMFVPRSAARGPAPEASAPLASVPTKSEKPLSLQEPEVSPAPPTRSIPRKQKTLRLDLVTDRALRMLATRDGVTQQSLMEAAVKTLISEKSDETGWLCGRGDR